MIRDPLLDVHPVLREIVNRLVAILDLRRVYLFGSQARRHAGAVMLLPASVEFT